MENRKLDLGSKDLLLTLNKVGKQCSSAIQFRPTVGCKTQSKHIAYLKPTSKEQLQGETQSIGSEK